MASVELLEKKLKEKTDEMFNTSPKQSHKRTRIMVEMKEIYRQIRTAKQSTPNG